MKLGAEGCQGIPIAQGGNDCSAYQGQHECESRECGVRVLTDIKLGETGKSLQMLAAICQRGALFQAELLQRCRQRKQGPQRIILKPRSAHDAQHPQPTAASRSLSSCLEALQACQVT